MSRVISCRLCLTSSNNYRNIFDEHGVHDMELYTITKKYFDKKFLAATYANLSPVVCSKCWHYMCEFNNFQHRINAAHAQLEKEAEHLLLIDDICALSNALPPLEVMHHRSSGHITSDITIKPEIISDYTASSIFEVPRRSKDCGSVKESIDNAVKDNDHNILDTTNSLSTWEFSHQMSSDPLTSVKSEPIPDDVICIGPSDFLIPVKSEPISDNDIGIADYEVDFETMDRGTTYEYSTINSITENIEYIVDDTMISYTCDKNIINQNFAKDENPPNDPLNIDNDSKLYAEIANDTVGVITRVEFSNIQQMNVNLPKQNAASNEEKFKIKTPREIDEYISKWKRYLQCEICHQSFSLLSQLSSHFKQQHPKIKCGITCCQRVHSGPTQIYQHAMLHLDPDIFKCQVCGKRYTSRRVLHDHQRFMHSELINQYKCSVCDRTFRTATDLKDHEAAHKQTKLFTSRRMEQKDKFVKSIVFKRRLK